MHAYVSCNCCGCRHVTSATKGQDKRVSHRKFRHESKLRLALGDETTPVVSTGPRS